MLERIALHQTRLETPGLSLDARGIALGTKGLVLLQSIDRLVALLAMYTRDRSLEDMIAGLAVYVVRSKLGTREVLLEFSAESSDRMDLFADIARLVNGFAFTGTSRHFVQYRDAAAPFGYDVSDLRATDATLILHHTLFSQAYEVEQSIDLRGLLLRLTLRIEPGTKLNPGPRIIFAEQGLGPALCHYLVRSHVPGEVCVVQSPPQGAFDDAPIRHWVMRVPELPDRMRPLLHSTPGIRCFVPAGPGVAVEAGFRHPVGLRACPLFSASGMVLFRGGGEPPWIVDRLPVMGDLTTFARVELLPEKREPPESSMGLEPAPVRVPLRLVPSSEPWRRVLATWIAPNELALFRRLAYALPNSTIARTEIAITRAGALLRSSAGIEGVPIGTFFAEIHPRLYVPAGYEVSPAVAPEVLARALALSPSDVIFIGVDSSVLAVGEGSFAPLQAALLAAPLWESSATEAIGNALHEERIDLKVTSTGLLPAQGVPLPPTGV
ncbi:MAG TPA: hypothetical protein VGY54_18145 [Polyangiaceae bacterium]|jgi:hypothetical protein|nr:hypothetical protein [Polyangiaceae bacterium]